MCAGRNKRPCMLGAVDDCYRAVSGGDDSATKGSRRVVDGFELDDLEATRHSGELEHHGLTNASSDQCLPDRRRHTHMSFLELDRISKHQAEALALARLLVLHNDLRSQSDLVGGNLGDVDLRQLAEALAQLAQPRLYELLPLERSLVLAVLAEIAQLDRLSNLLGKGDVQLILKLLDLFSELLLQCFDHMRTTGATRER